MATGIAVRCLRDARCRQCTGKRLSRTIWSSFNKARMSHLCDSTVAGPTAQRDNVLASKCEYPPFRYPPFKCALYYSLNKTERSPNIWRISSFVCSSALVSEGCERCLVGINRTFPHFGPQNFLSQPAQVRTSLHKTPHDHKSHNRQANSHPRPVVRAPNSNELNQNQPWWETPYSKVLNEVGADGGLEGISF